MKKTRLLFDINETILDLAPLGPKFNAIFGDDATLPLWFSQLLHASTVCAVSQQHSDFASLAQICLRKLCQIRHIDISDTQVDDTLNTFAALPPHPDVEPALRLLKDAGFYLAALSNSSQQLLNKQISQAGLKDYFEQLLSVESARTFKPHATAYAFAVSQCQCPAQQIRLVAAHDWDTHGAMSAGLKGAFVNRQHTLYHPVFLSPDIHADNLIDVARHIIAEDA